MARGHPETAGEFFDRIQEKVKSAKHVPAWDGELYLEYHRGTYTTHSYNKKQNRKIEYALCETEWLQLLGEWKDYSTQFKQETLDIRIYR